MIKLPSGVNIKDLVNDLIISSWEASEKLLYYSQIVGDTKDKSNILKNENIDDPVTIADLTVNELIIQKIKEKYKHIDWDILSEENVKSDSPHRFRNFDWRWVLDPLDGTKDFIQGSPNYAMHLALNYKQRPLIGIVLIPAKGELWISDGSKVWCEKKDGSKFRPNLYKKNSLSEMVLVTSKNHTNKSLDKLIKKIDFKGVCVMGSIGCKIASIVKGESDIYICISLPGQSSPKDWDFAAPEAILKASGGRITNLYNEELTYGSNNFEHNGVIIASNNSNMHERICLEIKEIINNWKILST